jgi:hypothetical protein
VRSLAVACSSERKHVTENGTELETKEERKTDIRIPDSIYVRKPISCSEWT